MIPRICGTPIEPAHDDARPCALLVSDLHVPGDGGPVLAAFARLVARARERAAATRLFVLGDLFDAYVGIRQTRSGAAREVVDLLAAAVRDGVSVTLLHGNRDFMLDSRFAAATGARVVAGGVSARLLGMRALLLHGDELCLNDTPYLRAKRWLRHPVTKLALRSLPLAAALRLSGAARKRSKATIGGGDPTRFTPVAAAVHEVQAAGYELLIFGHIHRPARGALEPGPRYCVLPAFDAAGEHLVAEGEKLWFADADGRARPDHPPLEFA